MPNPLLIRVALWVWLIAAVGVGYFRVLTPLPLPAVQAVLFLLTALLLAGYAKLAGLRSWIDRLDLRALVLFHLTRFAGFYFLMLYERGQLPYDFAVRGGWGDIVVAALALLICVLPLGDAARRRFITIWNVIGLADILMGVTIAARHGLQGNLQMQALTVLPLSLLPTFIVPIVIASHVIIFLRLRRAAADDA